MKDFYSLVVKNALSYIILKFHVSRLTLPLLRNPKLFSKSSVQKSWFTLHFDTSKVVKNVLNAFQKHYPVYLLLSTELPK